MRRTRSAAVPPMPTSRRRGAARAGAAATACALGAIALTACGEQSPLDPRSDPARNIATLWWWMLGIAVVVFLGAIGMLVLAWRRRAEEGLPLLGTGERAATGLVLTFGIAVPVIVLSGLFGVANVGVLETTNAPEPHETEMTIEIVGHQWFWEVRYPGTTAVTANEVHIPTDTPINVVATTEDVIHSLWVPQLNRKIDTIPGRRNRVLWYADRPGRYRGQCSEFCGVQHAHMGMYVFAQPAGEFRAWLDEQSRPRTPPATPEAERGEQVFLDNACAACHTIRGTEAEGRIGPDLTHLQSRETLAALTIPNGEDDLAGWVRDPQHVKPGNRMPALDLRGPELQDLLAYLEGLE